MPLGHLYEKPIEVSGQVLIGLFVSFFFFFNIELHELFEYFGD